MINKNKDFFQEHIKFTNHTYEQYLMPVVVVVVMIDLLVIDDYVVAYITKLFKIN